MLFGDPAAQAAAQAAVQANALAVQQTALAAQQLYNSGVYLLNAGNKAASHSFTGAYYAYKGAINEFLKALNITPNDATILHGLADAKQKLKDLGWAQKNSDALASALGGAGAGAGKPDPDQPPPAPAANPNASALSLVNLDTNVVDLRSATTTSPASLKSQLDAVLGNPAPVSAPPAAQVTAADVAAVFDKHMPDPNATMKAIFDLNDKSK
jgi:hypothetical protein